MAKDARIDGIEPTPELRTDADDALLQDEAIPIAGAAPDPDASGEDAGDALRRAAGADPAAAGMEPEERSTLLPTPD